MKRISAALIGLLASALLTVACAAQAPSQPQSSAAKPAAPAEPILLRVAEYSPPTGDRADAGNWFVKEVESRTQGKVKFQMYWSESLLKTNDMLGGIGAGTADIGFVALTNFPGQLPLATVFFDPVIRWPYGTVAADELVWRLYETSSPLQAELTGHNVKLITTFAYTPHHYIGKKAAATFDAFKGLKIRSAGVRHANMLKAAGAIPTSLTPPEIYSGIDLGTVDGAMFTLEAIKRYDLNKVSKHITLIDYAPYTTGSWLINTTTWGKLPADVQKIMLEVGKEQGKRYAAAQEQGEAKYIDDFKKEGLQVVTLSPADLDRWFDKPEIKTLADTWLQGAEKAGRNREAQEVWKQFQDIVVGWKKK